MRFVITGEWSRNRLLQTIIFLYALYVLGLWLTNALLYFNKMSLSYASVVRYYRGDAEAFLSPKSYQGLLEVSHFHLFAMGMLLLVLTHLVLFIPISSRWKAALIIVPFCSAILEEAASWLTRFVAPGFAYLKISMFLLLETSLLALILLSLWSVFVGSNANYRDTKSSNYD